MIFFFSPIASLIVDRFGIRKTSFLGGFLAALGMLLSSFATSLGHLYITYGLILGIGASLAYAPSLVILGHYFDKRLGLANGIVTAGSSSFTMIMPLLLDKSLEVLGLSITFNLLALLMSLVMLCALTFKEGSSIGGGKKSKNKRRTRNEGAKKKKIRGMIVVGKKGIKSSSSSSSKSGKEPLTSPADNILAVNHDANCDLIPKSEDDVVATTTVVVGLGKGGETNPMGYGSEEGLAAAAGSAPHHHHHERDSAGSDMGVMSQSDEEDDDHILNRNIWHNKLYLLWVIAIPTALFGYFVPYVHLVNHVRDIMPHANGKVLVTCIGATSGVGRLVFGKIADCPNVNRIFLQQVAFVAIGILTILLTVFRNFPAFVVICLGLGLFDGCFISLLGPIAFDLCGPKGASQAIGFLLGLCSVPLTVGPPVAGKFSF